MKVIAINGSPRSEGNTHYAIQAVLQELEKEGIEGEEIRIGHRAVRGCLACGKCGKNKNEECVQTGDDLNLWIQKIKQADGLVLGSPVYFSAVAGTMKCFLDRAFYVAGSNGGLFRHKVGISVVADRRAGAVPAFDQMNNYLHYAEMFVPSSNYWNVVYGTLPGDAAKDREGEQILRILGRNMAWLLKSVQEGKSTRPLPEGEKKVYFHYIRD